ncbi:indole-3-glycerol phosphate synthase TrpC [Anoxybacillus rupiensis]|jgi:indole-3-glycerol phosphate synthase|uniref:Indole-3-glycerol phosphate synthase n=1 Tax=Anoxybacteroides rupiense TaxID=311460 RepID=A0ABT5W1F4_9BACL|nr:indole-3-glycerol phosphate synthase TrpC [Anoxybacillus rupiensis]MDE8562360.1 indole-3-glycerol phosphate synthase TrpC [Anoxybacillus rupiensis]
MLKQILATKQNEIERIELPPRYHFPRFSLCTALKNAKRSIGMIAEVKKASPSKGIIRPNFQPVEIAKAYEQAGVDAISVLTDQTYFQGHYRYLIEIKETVRLPVLRKDFIIERLQIEESARIGADAILLIGEALSPKKLHELYEEAYEKGLECLVEVHSRQTLEAILERFTPEIVGINNRDLQTFTTSLDTTKNLLPHVPPSCVVVSESGIANAYDLQRVRAYGAHAVLVGESLMRHDDVMQAVDELYKEVRSDVRPS